MDWSSDELPLGKMTDTKKKTKSLGRCPPFCHETSSPIFGNSCDCPKAVPECVPSQYLCSYPYQFLSKILNALVASTFRQILDCVKEIDSFGFGAHLQLDLDFEFIHQTLLVFETPSSMLSYTKCRDYVATRQLVSPSKEDTFTTARLKQECVERTKLQFSAFRNTLISSEVEKTLEIPSGRQRR